MGEKLRNFKVEKISIEEKNSNPGYFWEWNLSWKANTLLCLLPVESQYFSVFLRKLTGNDMYKLVKFYYYAILWLGGCVVGEFYSIASKY